MRFGVHIPTCIEGLTDPVPFAGPQDLVPIALLAEELGDAFGGWQRPHDDPAICPHPVRDGAELL